MKKGLIGELFRKFGQAKKVTRRIESEEKKMLKGGNKKQEKPL